MSKTPNTNWMDPPPGYNDKNFPPIDVILGTTIKLDEWTDEEGVVYNNAIMGFDNANGQICITIETDDYEYLIDTPTVFDEGFGYLWNVDKHVLIWHSGSKLEEIGLLSPRLGYQLSSRGPANVHRILPDLFWE